LQSVWASSKSQHSNGILTYLGKHEARRRNPAAQCVVSYYYYCNYYCCCGSWALSNCLKQCWCPSTIFGQPQTPDSRLRTPDSALDYYLICLKLHALNCRPRCTCIEWQWVSSSSYEDHDKCLHLPAEDNGPHFNMNTLFKYRGVSIKIGKWKNTRGPGKTGSYSWIKCRSEAVWVSSCPPVTEIYGFAHVCAKEGAPVEKKETACMRKYANSCSRYWNSASSTKWLKYYL